MEKFYVTTPIYYVNDKPHIGHAYTTIAADVLARYHRSQGEEVFFLTGTDEHGAKIAEAAKKAGKSSKEFVDEQAPIYENCWKKLNISYDGFLRTTNPEHEKEVQDFIKKLDERGFIEKKRYEGLYCVGCERYLLADELVDGKCPDHQREPEKKSEENYFFLLSKFQDQLLRIIESDELVVAPASRKNEVLGKIKQGLADVSISRESVEWGIPYPGDEKQTVYVWFDALINYYSAPIIYQNLKLLPAGRHGKTQNFPTWPADLHLMAKDILWFHAIVWPAMLLALGEKLPKKIFAHGFFTIDGKKMSKSLGNVLDPIELSNKYGSDVLRYALLRQFPFGEDGDISEAKIAERYERDLANGLGNLLNRTLVMIEKYNIKSEALNSKFETNPKSQISNSKLIEELKFDQYLAEIWKEIGEQNRIIDEAKPWELFKNNETEKLAVILGGVYGFLASIILPLSFFMPETARKMKDQLKTLKPEPLFPRLN